jgi:CheY-like chemotaxis protein
MPEAGQGAGRQRIMNPHGPILVVDENPAIRNAVGELIELSGHTALLAQDGAEAMGYLRQGVVPCLILLDIETSNYDGINFRREQLADPVLAPIPVILHSNHPAAARLAVQLQAVTHITKPVDFDRLLQLVGAYCYMRNP